MGQTELIVRPGLRCGGCRNVLGSASLLSPSAFPNPFQASRLQTAPHQQTYIDLTNLDHHSTIQSNIQEFFNPLKLERGEDWEQYSKSKEDTTMERVMYVSGQIPSRLCILLPSTPPLDEAREAICDVEDMAVKGRIKVRWYPGGMEVVASPRNGCISAQVACIFIRRPRSTGCIGETERAKTSL